MFKKFIYSKQSHLDQRFHEELIAQLCLKYTKEFTIDLKAAQLDELYEARTILDKDIIKEVHNVLGILCKMAANVPQAFIEKKKLTKGMFHALCDVVHLIFSQGYTVKRPKALLTWFLEVDAEARSAAADLTEAEKENSYIYWIKYYYNRVCYSRSRQLYSDQLAVSYAQLVKDGTLAKKRTHRDCFSRSNIDLHLWVDQAHTDRNYNEIDILDIYLGKTHVDHVRSVRDGGATTYDNAELMMAEDNLTKGASSNAAAFPHQKEFAFPEDAEDDD